jgi:predicted ATPase
MHAAEPFEAPANAYEEDFDAGDFSGPLEWYWHFSQRGDFQTDSEQLKVLQELQRLFEQLEEYRQYRQGKLNRLVTNLGAGRKPRAACTSTAAWGAASR